VIIPDWMITKGYGVFLVNTFEGNTLSQQIQSVLNKLNPELACAHSSAIQTRSWVYQNRVAVFDYIIHGREIAFDVTITDHGGLRVEVFDRKNSTNSNIEMLRLDFLGNGRFLATEIVSFVDSEDLVQQTSQAIQMVIEQIILIGHHPSDAHIVRCVGAILPLVVVDVGANDLSPPPYLSLREAGICKIIGFEPQDDAFNLLQINKREDEMYFPFAIGAPGKVDLNIYKYSGFTSIYKIDENTIGIAPNWFSGTRLQRTASMNCLALDEVPGLPNFDLLKIDIQGGELNVFQNARRLLASALCIITEVSFFPLYENAPSFADVHQELVNQGFLLHKFLHQTKIAIASSYETVPSKTLESNQLIDGDAVYLRDYRNMENLSSSDIKKLALLGHFVFSSKDFVIRMLGELVRRKETLAKLVDGYIGSA
jgi:FkbM family methyltransferase